MTTIVGLGGSLSDRSASLAALRLALDGAADAGAAVVLLDVRELDLPYFGSPGGESHPGVTRLVDAVGAADGHVWASPLYHGTVSGAFKNALDWLQLLADGERPYLTDQPVGLIATAGGVQGLQAINTMEFVVRALRGWTVPFTVPISRAWQAFDADGRPVDSALADQLHTLGGHVAQAAERFATQAV